MCSHLFHDFKHLKHLYYKNIMLICLGLCLSNEYIVFVCLCMFISMLHFRSIVSAKQCLEQHYKYCDITGKLSINNTLKLLSDMEFIICEPNKLLEGPDVDCVAMTMKNSSEGTCNISMAMECGSFIQKAMHNPFLQQAEYCGYVFVLC